MIRPASARPSGPLVAAVVMLGLFALMAAHVMVAQPPVTQPLDDAWRAWVGADAPVGGPLFWFLSSSATDWATPCWLGSAW